MLLAVARFVFKSKKGVLITTAGLSPIQVVHSTPLGMHCLELQ
jgi:hypothetical protein